MDNYYEEHIYSGNTNHQDIDEDDEDEYGLIPLGLSKSVSTSVSTKEPSRKRRVYKCGTCGEFGHYARTCERRNKTL